MAARIHGISGQDVAGAPAFTYVEQDVRHLLEGRVVVAHNAHVDVSVLQRELGQWECPEVFDTLNSRNDSCLASQVTSSGHWSRRCAWMITCLVV